MQVRVLMSLIVLFTWCTPPSHAVDWLSLVAGFLKARAVKKGKAVMVYQQAPVVVQPPPAVPQLHGYTVQPAGLNRYSINQNY